MRKSYYREAHGKCWYCGEGVSRNDFVLEHQEPFSRGGADSRRNLVVSCRRCDCWKGKRNVEEFRARLQEKFGVETRIAFHGEGYGCGVIALRVLLCRQENEAQ